MNPLIKTRDHRIQVARRLTRIFNEWQLSDRERIRLLGLRRQGLATLERYSRGCPLAQKAELLERAVMLLEIHLALKHYCCPHGSHREWLCGESIYFGFATPLSCMLRGVDLLRLVHKFVVQSLIGQERFRVARITYLSSSGLNLIKVVKKPAMYPEAIHPTSSL